jgi:glycosyltransferase involved in cell wall biosynthesis
MRVALDGFPLSSPKTGIGHYTFELARSLAQLAPADRFDLVSPLPFTAAAASDSEQASLPNLGFINPRATSIRRHWWAVGLPLYLRQSPVDLFHGTNYEVPLWNRSHNVVTIHDLSILLHPEHHERHLVRRARRRLPLMVRSAAMIIAVTESMKREIVEHLGVKPDRVAVTPEAPRRSFHRIPITETLATRKRLEIEDDFLLFVGTVEPRKNLITLVRALDDVLQNTSIRPQLVIAGGKGWLADELHAFLETSAVKERVRFIGYTSDEDLRALYSSCRICVYPSLYEGFGLPPLEAMACGASVITSRIPAIEETVGSAAMLVDPTDVAGLAKAIVELWNDPHHREHLSAAGLKRAAGFTWERTAQLTLDVYREMVARNDRHRGRRG